MNRTPSFTVAVIVAAMSMAAAPAGAQNRGGGHERGGGRSSASQPAPRQESGGRQQAVPRQAPPQASQSAPRQYSAPQSQAPQPQVRANEGRSYSAPQAVPRSFENRQYSAPQQGPRTAENRSYATPQAVPRSFENRQYSAQQPSQRAQASRPMPAAPPPGPNTRSSYAGERAVPRAYGQPTRGGQPYRQDDRRGYGAPPNGPRPPAGGHYGQSYGHSSYYARGYHSEVYVRPHYYAPYRPYYFGHTYYSFRPWWNIGFGVWVGYTVPYPYTYLGAYAPRVYGYDYYADGSYRVTAGVPIYGGVSFDIQPSDADLFIDSEYVGTVDTFNPNAEPLTLTPGLHRIAIQRDGYRPMEWDVTIEPGKVIPYRGAMDRF
jgi:hypothetical protein